MRLPALLTPLLLLALTLDTGCMQRERTNVDVETPDAPGGPTESADGGKEVPGSTAGPAAGGAIMPAPAGGGATQNYSGNLAQGDQTLQSGEFVDWYTVSAQTGQTITVDMVSASNLDPYLLLRGPGGQERDNDDLNGDRTRSQIVHTVTEGGTFQIGATSYQPGETGAYTVTVGVGQGGGGSATPATPPAGGK